MADLRVGHFTAAKLDRYLDLVAFVEKALRAAQLGVKIVVINFGTETHFFELGQVLMLLRLPILLGLLVLELSIIKQATHGRDAIGGDLNEVHVSIARDLEGLRGLQNAKLVAVLIND